MGREELNAAASDKKQRILPSAPELASMLSKMGAVSYLDTGVTNLLETLAHEEVKAKDKASNGQGDGSQPVQDQLGTVIATLIDKLNTEKNYLLQRRQDIAQRVVDVQSAFELAQGNDTAARALLVSAESKRELLEVELATAQATYDTTFADFQRRNEERLSEKAEVQEQVLMVDELIRQMELLRTGQADTIMLEVAPAAKSSDRIVDDMLLSAIDEGLNA